MNYERDGHRRHYVYRIYDRDGVCIYVGMTLNLTKRIKQHSEGPQLAGHIWRWDATEHADLRRAAAAEARLIRELRPRHNIAGRGPRDTWTACDYFEAIEHFSAGDFREHNKTLPGLLSEYRLRYPDIAEQTLPALGLQDAPRKAAS